MHPTGPNTTVLVVSADQEFLHRIGATSPNDVCVVETYASFADVPMPFPLRRFGAAICDYCLGTVPAIEFLEALDVALGNSFKIFPIILVCAPEALKSLRGKSWPLSVRRVIPKAVDCRILLRAAALEAAAAKAVDAWAP
jgi:hypothetical protein